MKLQTVSNVDGDFLHYCEGCDMMHQINTKRKNHLNAQWKFDGNMQNPTFKPSIKIDLGNGKLCHYIITSGIIFFQSDCTHWLKGQNIPLCDIPEDYAN